MSPEDKALCERLRNVESFDIGSSGVAYGVMAPNELHDDAADAIERLSAMVAELEAQVGDGKDWGKRGQMLDAAEKRIAELEDAFTSLRDTVLNERGALAEGGFDGDQINAVLGEFDAVFPPARKET